MCWKITKRTIAVAAIGMLAACAHESVTEAEFGDSVRHVSRHQTYDLDAAYNPDPQAVLGSDIERLNNVLDMHRNSVAEPAPGVGTTIIDLRGQ